MVRLQQLPIRHRNIDAKRTLEDELLQAEVADPKSGCHEVAGGVDVCPTVVTELEDEEV
jgi:hypothetical protein